jgi:EF hand domain-containing protein
MSPIGVVRLVNVADPRQVRDGTGANDPCILHSNGHTMTNSPKELRRAGHQPSRQCSGEFMKISKSMIAMAVIAVLPLAAIAGDKDKTPAPMGTSSSAQFDKLDTNRDGRISQAEAASDTKIVFSTADKNGDGYLDSSEYTQREMSRDAMPNSSAPASDPDNSR